MAVLLVSSFKSLAMPAVLIPIAARPVRAATAGAKAFFMAKPALADAPSKFLNSRAALSKPLVSRLERIGIFKAISGVLSLGLYSF